MAHPELIIVVGSASFVLLAALSMMFVQRRTIHAEAVVRVLELRSRVEVLRTVAELEDAGRRAAQHGRVMAEHATSLAEHYEAIAAKAQVRDTITRPRGFESSGNGARDGERPSA